MSDQTTLYRHFNTAGELLYIGISIDAFNRYKQHAKEKAWIGEITSTTYEPCETREIALLAEKLAIQREKPKYNIIFNKIVSEKPEKIVLEKPEKIVFRKKPDDLFRLTKKMLKEVSKLEIYKDKNIFYKPWPPDENYTLDETHELLNSRVYRAYYLNRRTKDLFIVKAIVERMDRIDIMDNIRWAKSYFASGRMDIFEDFIESSFFVKIDYSNNYDEPEIFQTKYDPSYIKISSKGEFKHFKRFSDIWPEHVTSEFKPVSIKELNHEGWNLVDSEEEGKPIWKFN